MLRNIKILAALLFLNTAALAQTVSPPTCSINGGTITCPGGSLTPASGLPGGANTQVQFNDSGVFGGSSLFTFNKTTGQISNNQGILTTSSPFTVTQTWNSGGTTFIGIQANVTDTASASNSLLMDLQVGGVSQFLISKTGAITALANIQAGTVNNFNWTSRSRINSPADGQITLLNNAQNGFTRLNFGGTTSSFPALKRSDAGIEVRLADDTNYANINFATPTILATTAIPAGGSSAMCLKATSTANFGICFGSGVPTLSAAKGSLYLRSDGTGTSDRAYINTNGSTTWTNLVTGS